MAAVASWLKIPAFILGAIDSWRQVFRLRPLMEIGLLDISRAIAVWFVAWTKL